MKMEETVFLSIVKMLDVVIVSQDGRVVVLCLVDMADMMFVRMMKMAKVMVAMADCRCSASEYDGDGRYVGDGGCEYCGDDRHCVSEYG